VKALVTETDLELVYCDRYVIDLLRGHAEAIGEDRGWLDAIFGWREETGSRPLVRHVDGHRTHIHARFYNPVAQESGRRLFPLLQRHRMLPDPGLLVTHSVAQGETLASLARLYKTSRRAIRRVNELASDDLVPGRTYLVPARVKLEPDTAPIIVPRRLLPPLAPRGAAGRDEARERGTGPSGT
jgi:penicillin-insensitive murein endopeptidase